MDPVLLFDGDCAFCSASAAFVTSRLRPSSMPYAVRPYQHVDLAPLGLGEAQCDAALQWVGPDGRVSSGHEAVARCLLASLWWARPAGAFLLLPGVRRLAAAAYRWVAAHRHRLPGGTAACSLPVTPPSGAAQA